MKRVNEWSVDDVFDKGTKGKEHAVLSWIHGFKYIRKVMGKDKGRWR